ncbi:putative GTP-binding protein Parf, partial [Temnothorax longispinosus]
RGTIYVISRKLSCATNSSYFKNICLTHERIEKYVTNELVTLRYRLNAKFLETHSISFIKLHIKEITDTKEFQSLPQKDLNKIMVLIEKKQELRISNEYEQPNEQSDINSDAFDNWLRRDSKWRQSPEGGEDVSSTSTRKDRLELSDKSLDVSVTSSNVHLELLNDTSMRQVSSNASSPVMKEKKKHEEKKEKRKKKKSKDKDKDKEKTEKTEKKKKRSSHRTKEDRERDELE